MRPARQARRYARASSRQCSFGAGTYIMGFAACFVPFARKVAKFRSIRPHLLWGNIQLICRQISIVCPKILCSMPIIQSFRRRRPGSQQFQRQVEPCCYGWAIGGNHVPTKLKGMTSNTGNRWNSRKMAGFCHLKAWDISGLLQDSSFRTFAVNTGD